MQKSDSAQSIKVVRRQVQPSATLNRRYVTPPKAAARRVQVNSDMIAVKTVSSASAKAAPAVKATPTTMTAKPTLAKMATAKPAAAKTAASKTSEKLSPEQLKELAVKRALRAAEKTPEPVPHKLHFSFGRIFLALICTAATVFALVYFINQNVFNLSVVNAAKSAGLEISASPKVPNGYELTDIVSEDGKITLNYSNPSNKTSFTLVEERSSWDSNALLTNFVKPTYGADYSIVREQGITIYISNSNAAWVNGRIVHKITAEPGTLTKKQIRSIATSF
ncbi:MAG: hypothetical protein K6G36_03775 [Candidatus Saccharibacteria bacterium]|nr:hypothetical protein [Candidatus Saccharibacteria bacterium]